jgi:hypothetical protein
MNLKNKKANEPIGNPAEPIDEPIEPIVRASP